MPKRVDHPIILGIVGDSASGKTTLSAGVAQILGEEHCSVFCTDDYHRYTRQERNDAGLSALDPRECAELIVQQPEEGRTAILFGRDAEDRRFIANTPDDKALLTDMTARDYLGATGTVHTNDDGINIFAPD